MIANSLRFRLLGAAAIFILIALPISGVTLLKLFERNVMRQIDRELDAGIEQLIANIEREKDDAIELSSEPADPRFRQPHSGRYWQIAGETSPLLRSRSLWDIELVVDNPPDPKEGARRVILAGPNRQRLYSTVRSIILEPDSAGASELRLILVTAMDATEIATLKAQFRGDVATALGVLALLMIAASWAQVSLGLKPLEVLRTGVESIRLGQARRVEGALPQELQPLASETNRLLEVQEQAIERARARAGDLAHGLKTPLTALNVVAQRLRDEGQRQVANDIEMHLRQLNAHIERELVRTRIAAEAGIKRQTPLAGILDRIVRTMRTLPRGDDIDWRVEAVTDILLPLDEVDLAEVLGNLLDNARKWANFVVEIRVRRHDGTVEVSVEDDGPGVSLEFHKSIMRRGLRLDETKPGSGLGLSIVKEIVEAYGGEIELANSDLGGLAVRFRFRGT